MIKGIDGVLLSSENARKLADFYREKVGLELAEEYEMGDKVENYFDFKMKGAGFGIMDHSDIKGKAKDPKRLLINIEVDDIDKEVARLKKNKVKVIQDKYHVESYGWIATFEDLDGNYFQLVQVRAS